MVIYGCRMTSRRSNFLSILSTYSMTGLLQICFLRILGARDPGWHAISSSRAVQLQGQISNVGSNTFSPIDIQDLAMGTKSSITTRHIRQALSGSDRRWHYSTTPRNARPHRLSGLQHHRLLPSIRLIRRKPIVNPPPTPHPSQPANNTPQLARHPRTTNSLHRRPHRPPLPSQRPHNVDLCRTKQPFPLAYRLVLCKFQPLPSLDCSFVFRACFCS